MKKIMYVVDFLPDCYNSVGDILNCLIEATVDCENIAVKSDGHTYSHCSEKIVNGIKCISADTLTIEQISERNDFNLVEKSRFILNKYLLNFARLFKHDYDSKISNVSYLKNAIKKERPDLIIFFVHTPKKEYSQICKKLNLKYFYMLYDTFIGSPEVDQERGYPLEKFVIDNSQGYFIPKFFAEDYYKTFGKEKIIEYNLPLLIEKENVIKAFDKKSKFKFTYFGQIQSFRNGEKIKKIFAELNEKLDVFTASEDCVTDEIFTVHNALTKDELYSTVAGSDFLVAFDNSVPYEKYLPSKAYLYVSFTKPIIVFGDNESSALKDFLSGYPKYYYQNINEPLDGLIKFINENQTSIFDEKIYSNYLEFLPKNALKKYKEIIKAIPHN